MHARRRCYYTYPEAQENAFQPDMRQRQKGERRERSEGRQSRAQRKQAWNPGAARGKCKRQAECCEKQGRGQYTAPHAEIARYKNQTPSIATMPPMLRVTAIPWGRLLRSPRPMPDTCKRPVARTK